MGGAKQIGMLPQDHKRFPLKRPCVMGGLSRIEEPSGRHMGLPILDGAPAQNDTFRKISLLPILVMPYGISNAAELRHVGGLHGGIQSPGILLRPYDRGARE